MKPQIKDWVMTLGRKHGIIIYKDQLTFQRIGKKSPAHKLAFRVYKKIIKPERVVTAKEVLAEFGE